MTEQPDNQQPSSEASRTCRKCGQEGPLSDFAIVYSQKNRGQQYRQHTCKVCHRKAAAEKERRRRAENPERDRAINRKSFLKHRAVKNERRRTWSYGLRDQVFEHYGGYRCRCCGETEKSMLTLDHINNDGGEHRKSEPALRWAKHMYAWIIKQGFPATFQVLCYNCNISKFRNGGVCAHMLREGSTTIPQGSTAKRPEMPSDPDLQPGR